MLYVNVIFLSFDKIKPELHDIREIPVFRL